MFFEQMHPSWQSQLVAFRQQLSEIESEIAGLDIVPEKSKVMRAFEKPIDHYRVLIVGQDPYPNPDHACGLAFAVESEGVRPPSLENILKELRSDLGRGSVRNGNVAIWADSGVMLLNRSLTTISGISNQHSKLWAEFTLSVVRILSESQPLVAVLWGRQAQQLAPVLSSSVVLSSPHPSPLSSYRGFFGSRPFSKVNAELIRLGEQPIDWTC